MHGSIVYQVQKSIMSGIWGTSGSISRSTIYGEGALVVTLVISNIGKHKLQYFMENDAEH